MESYHVKQPDYLCDLEENENIPENHNNLDSASIQNMCSNSTSSDSILSDEPRIECIKSNSNSTTLEATFSTLESIDLPLLQIIEVDSAYE